MFYNNVIIFGHNFVVHLLNDKVFITLVHCEQAMLLQENVNRILVLLQSSGLRATGAKRELCHAP